MDQDLHELYRWQPRDEAQSGEIMRSVRATSLGCEASGGLLLSKIRASKTGRRDERVKKNYNDDLFGHTTMTFGEHLEELRVCLFRAILGLVAGFVVGLLFGNRVVLAIQTPLTRALANYYLDKAKTDADRRFGDRLGPEIRTMIADKKVLPQEVLIEPGALLETLSGNDPSFAGKPRSSYYRITTGDLPHPEQLAIMLTEAAAEKSPVSLRVRKLLSESERKVVDQVASAGEPTSADRERLAAALNSLLDRRNLYDEESFGRLEVPEPLREDIARRHELSDRRELRQLNWSLLSMAFPGQITAPHPELVSIYLWRRVEDDERLRPQSLGVQEPFMIYIKAALVTGLVLSSPWVFYQIWAFVAAGLYPHEKRYIHLYMPFSICLFLAGASLAFFFVFDPVLQFLFSFNDWLGIDPDPRIGDWLSFVMMLPLGFGVAFQLPLVMVFLQRIGIFDVNAYLAKWRIAILAIFIISAVLTPADPYSMLLMAVPLTFLYFGGILLCRWLPTGRNPYEEV